MQWILVESDEFENWNSLLYIPFKSYLKYYSLATLARQQQMASVIFLRSNEQFYEISYL